MKIVANGVPREQTMRWSQIIYGYNMEEVGKNDWGCPLDQNAEPIRFFPLERDSRTKNIIQGILCWVEMACPLMTSLLSHCLRTPPCEQREDNPKERWLRLREQLNAARQPHTCV